MKPIYRVTLTSLWAIGAIAPGLITQPVEAQPAANRRVRIAACPNDYKLKIVKLKGQQRPVAVCIKSVKRRVRDYIKSYRPCVAPGVYRANDEAPRTGGQDRCTTSGFSGPALPCPRNAPLREIRRRKVDRCYKFKRIRTKEFTDLTVVTPRVKRLKEAL